MMSLLTHSGDASPATPEPVRRALEGLALALNHSLTPEQGRVYAFTLRDISPSDLQAACMHLAGTATFWPKPVEIREASRRIARDRALVAAALPTADREPTYRCLTCLDDPAGWIQMRRCPDTPCERRQPHPPHTFTARCRCWLERNAGRLDLRRQDALQDNTPIPFECDALNDLRDGRYRWARPY